MQFLQSLSESKLFPSKASLARKRDGEVAELAYYYLLAIRVLRLEDETQRWAKRYAKKTAEWGNFEKWRDSANDLYCLLHRLNDVDHPDKGKAPFPVDLAMIQRWLANEGRGEHDNRLARRILTGLDFSLKIKSQTAKSLRRIVMDWDEQDTDDKLIYLTKMVNALHTKAPRSEILIELKKLVEIFEDEVNETETT